MVVEEDQVGGLASLDRPHTVVDAHEAGGIGGGHPYGVGHRHPGLLDHDLQQADAAGDAAGQRRVVGELADPVLDDHPRVEAHVLRAEAGRGGHRVADEADPVYPLEGDDQAQDGGRHVNPVGDELDRHLRHEVYALDRPLVLVFPLLMHAAHGVVEMGGVGEPRLVGLADGRVVGRRMAQRDQDAPRPGIAGELECPGQLGRRRPAPDEAGALQKLAVFRRVGSLDEPLVLPALQERVDVIALEVQPLDTGPLIRGGHDRLARPYGPAIDVGRRDGQGRVERRHPAGGVGIGDGLEGLGCRLGEIVAVAPMQVRVDAARSDVSPAGVDRLGAFDPALFSGYFRYASRLQDQSGLAIYALRRDHPRVDNLYKFLIHDIWLLLF